MQKKLFKILFLSILTLGLTITTQAQFAPSDDFDGDGIVNSIDMTLVNYTQNFHS